MIEFGILNNLNSWISLNDNNGLIDDGYFNIQEGKNSKEFVLKVKADNEYKLSYNILTGNNLYTGYYNNKGTVT